MTRERAIQILQASIDNQVEVDELGLEDAKKLGIEALKLLQHLRHHPEDGKKLGFITLLPGETMNFNLKVIQEKEGK